MTKCHLVQDLLPNYIDGLVGPETEADIHEHLQQCEVCRALHAKLSVSIENTVSPSDQKEIDFLKKVRKKTTKKMIAGFAVLLLLVAVAAYYTAIGSPVSKKDLVYTTHLVGDEWRMEMELTNGKALLVRSEWIYGEPNSSGNRPIIGTVVKPYQLVPSPLLEADNTSFMYGIGSWSKYDGTIILRLAEEDIVFTSDSSGGQ